MEEEPVALVQRTPPERLRRAPTPLAGVASVVAAAAVLPLVYLIVRSAEGGLSAFIEVLAAPRTLSLTARTLLLTIAVTASTLLIGVPLAWLTSRTDLPARRLWAVVTALPLVIPSYVGAYVFIAALAPGGLAEGLLGPLGVGRLPSIRGFSGAWLVLTLFTYPYVLLTVRGAVAGLDPALEEAGRTLTRGRLETFLRITLPSLRPAAASGALLVALYTLHDFGAVSLTRYPTFTFGIFVRYRATFDRTSAAVLALLLGLLSLLVVFIETRARGKGLYHRVHTSAARPRSVVPLGRWRWPAAGACLALSLAALGIPLAVLGYWIVRGSASVQPTLAVSAATNSLSTSGIAAVAAVAAAIPVAVLAVRFPSRLSRTIERAAFTSHGLPGLVVALSLVFFGIRVAPVFYQTRGMLVFAYTILFLPLAVSAIRSSLLQVPPRLEDAARTLGASRLGAFRRISLPLVAPGLVGGAALVFLTAMKELPATLLLAPLEFRTLATQVWSAASEAFFARAALPALLLVGASSIPLAVLLFRERKGEAASSLTPP